MTSSHTRLARDLADLVIGSPFVAASRIARLTAPGAVVSSRNKAEMTRMVVEKQSAAMESFFSLAATYQQNVMNFWMSAAFMQPISLPSEEDVIAASRRALKPYRTRVNANARRLGRRGRKA